MWRPHHTVLVRHDGTAYMPGVYGTRIAHEGLVSASSYAGVEVSTAPFRFVGPEILRVVSDLGYEPVQGLAVAEPPEASGANPAVTLAFVEMLPSHAQALMLATQVAWRIHGCAQKATGDVRVTHGPSGRLLARVKTEDQPVG